MSDKLDWMNQHYLFFRRKTVKEAVELEKYKLSAELKPIADGECGSGDFLQALCEREKYREACEFLAYAIHRRIAVWWGYRCFLRVSEELEMKLPGERDIADIGKPKPMPVPEWARMPESAPEPSDLSALKSQLDDMKKELDARIPPQVRQLWDAVYNRLNGEFKNLYGHSMEEIAEQIGKRVNDPLFTIDGNSPIFQESAKLREQIEKKRRETIDLIKTVLPKMPESEEKRVRGEALRAIYQWIVAPGPQTSQAALDAGNVCPGTAAGLLALTAFWSFGDMNPGSEQIIPTPAGLAANGLSNVLLKLALLPGGTRNFKERCRCFLEIGLEVLEGKSNWGESIEHEDGPFHRAYRKYCDSLKSEEKTSSPGIRSYKKWKPEQKKT